MSRTSAVEPAIRNGLCYVMFAYDTAFSILLDKWEASVIRKLQTLESILE